MSLDVAAGLLTCPSCHGVLDLVTAQARCPAGHTFDVARQGHLNLLGAPQPKNADTGSMLLARSRVLDGLYGDVVALVAETAAALGPRVVVDVGAGTGQYLAATLDAVPGAVGIATDVSVAAARRAASAHPRLASVVADTWRGLPVTDQSADLVLCVFAPRNPAEFSRLLAPGGHLVVVTPEPGHLETVRAAYGLLDLDPGKDRRLKQSLSGLFEPVSSTRFTRMVDATAEEVRDVVAMGPNAFHGTRATGPAKVEIDVRCRTYRRLQHAAHGESDLPEREDGEDER